MTARSSSLILVVSLFLWTGACQEPYKVPDRKGGDPEVVASSDGCEGMPAAEYSYCNEFIVFFKTSSSDFEQTLVPIKQAIELSGGAIVFSDADLNMLRVKYPESSSGPDNLTMLSALENVREAFLRPKDQVD